MDAQTYLQRGLFLNRLTVLLGLCLSLFASPTFSQNLDPCGPCKGKVSQLTLRYIGTLPDAHVVVIQKDGYTNFDEVIQPGTEISFFGTDDGTFDNEVKIYINDTLNAAIHTSCSRPIGPGLVSGDFLVISGASLEGGQLCPLPTCDECYGKVTQLTLRYQGSTPNAQIRVVQKNQETVFNGTVQPGETFKFNGTDSGTLGYFVEIFVNDIYEAFIDTSCDSLIGPGLERGSFLVVEGFSEKNGKLCPLPDCGPCDGKVSRLTLRYDGPLTNALVEVLQNNDLTVYSGTVNTYDRFTFDGRYKGTFEKEIKIYVNGSEHAAIHTSCSQEIGPGLSFGHFTVISGFSSKGGPLCPFAPINDPPLAGHDTATTPEDTPIAIPVLNNDTDIDNDPLTVSHVSQPSHGSTSINADGTVQYTPKTNYHGPDSFTYTADDGQGGTATATVTLTVTPVNDAPTANPDTVPAIEDTPLNIDVLANDIDADGDPLTIINVSQPNHGSTSIDPDGTLRYIPDPDYNGPDAFTYTVEDGQGGTATVTVTLNVGPVNDSPTPKPDTVPVTEDTPLNIDVLANDTDIDGDPLTITSVSQPSHGSASINPDGTIRYIPNPDYNGPDSFTYTVDDGQGGTATATVTLNVGPVNDPPTPKPDTVPVTEDTPLNIDVLANDTDIDGDPLTIINVSQPTHGSTSINPDGTIRYIPDPDYNGPDSFTYTVDDGQGGTATATVTLNVGPANDLPTPTPDTVPATEDTPLNIDVLANDTDIDGDPLTIINVSQPSHGSTSINPDGTIRYIPDPDYNGPDSFTYTVDDGQGGAATATVTIEVGPANDPPTPKPDTVPVTEDTPLNIDVLANDTDIDGDPLTIINVSQPSHGSTSINPDGTIRYIPDPDYNGPDSFTYTVDDGQGGTATVTVTLNVGPANDAPTPKPDTVPVTEDTPLNIDVLANDTDIDGDPLTIINVSQPSHGSTSINPDGTIRYIPNPDYNGPDSFTYTVDDGQGETATATVTLNVTPANDSPTANTDATSTREDVSIDINVLANDTDVDGDPISLHSVSQPTHGTASINPNGTIRYIPDPDYHGPDSFTYTINDPADARGTATVQIQVRPANDDPAVNADLVSTPEETPININVLANDSDIDGDTLAVQSVTQPLHGSVTINPDQTIRYNPDPDYTGPDSFNYTVHDGQGGTATATVTLTVSPVNDPPVANPETTTTDEDTSVNIPVLDNDSDIDGDALMIFTLGQPLQGSTSINPDGSVRYTPNANYAGPDSFTYSVTDGNTVSTEATVTITVKPVNDDPVAKDDLASTEEDTSVNIPVLANDSDPDGDALSVTGVTNGSLGSAAIQPDGTVTYTPNQDVAGNDSFSYTIQDPSGASHSATVYVAITSLNDDPVAQDDLASTEEDTSVNIPVLANDSDPDGDALSVTSVTNGSLGSAAIQPDGTVTYTPNQDVAGNDSFSYTIQDPSGASHSATVYVAITSLNDDPVAQDDLASTEEDTAVNIPVLANDSDPDGDALSVTGVTNGSLGSAAIQPNGTVTYTPNQDVAGNDSFSYTIQDPSGASHSATVYVAITSLNDDPVAQDDLASTEEDTSVNIPVLANDSDPDGDALSVTGVTNGSLGSAVIQPDGTVTYTPNQDVAGNDSFSYTIQDPSGASHSATVYVAITSLNDDPVAQDDLASTEEDTPVNIPVLANDSDPDGDSLSVTGVTNGSLGSAAIQPDGTVTYTPNQDVAGNDSFSYTIQDPSGASHSATVYVAITSLNDDPVARPDHASTGQGIPVDVNVTANDMDPDGDPLSVTSTSQAQHGTVTILPNGSVRYTPATGYFGPDTFEYVVSDGNGGSASARVTLDVAQLNQPPVAQADLVQGLQNTTICVSLATLLANDLDPDGDALVVTQIGDTGSASGRTLILDGVLSYTPPTGFIGTDTLTYQVSDGQAAPATGTITIQVSPPQIDILEELQINPQTALFEEKIKVTNPVVSSDCGTMAAFIILIDGLPANATVHNATGQTNGLWFIQYNQSIDPGDSVDLVVEFHLRDRQNLPDPIYIPAVTTPGQLPDVTGQPFEIDRLTTLQNGRIMIDFTSTPGHTYAVQYSDAKQMPVWKTAFPFVTATANRVQWLDDGPPKTDSLPANAESRYYRILLLTTP